MSVIVITLRPKTEPTKFQALGEKLAAALVESLPTPSPLRGKPHEWMSEAYGCEDCEAKRPTAKPTDHAEETGGFILEATALLERLCWAVGDDPDNETRMNVRDSDERRFACVRLQEALMWLEADLKAIEKQNKA